MSLITARLVLCVEFVCPHCTQVHVRFPRPNRLDSETLLTCLRCGCQLEVAFLEHPLKEKDFKVEVVVREPAAVE